MERRVNLVISSHQQLPLTRFIHEDHETTNAISFALYLSFFVALVSIVLFVIDSWTVNVAQK
jgi:hypothetical protein